MGRSLIAFVLAVALGGCTAAPYKTYATAFGDYDQVFSAAVKVLDKYSFLRVVDEESGLVIGELKPDSRFLDPTRRELVARVLRKDSYNDVHVRVVYSWDMSEPDPFNGSVPSYQWQRLDFDRNLEQRITMEIKDALSGEAWSQKQPLPGKAPAAGATSEEPATTPLEEVSAADQAVLDALETDRVDFSFQEVDLREVFDAIRDSTGLTVVLARSAREVFDELEPTVSLRLHDVKLRDALDLLKLNATAPFDYRVQNGALVITAPRLQMR